MQAVCTVWSRLLANFFIALVVDELLFVCLSVFAN